MPRFSSCLSYPDLYKSSSGSIPVFRLIVGLVVMILVGVAAKSNQLNYNTDAISYVQIAKHYMEGNFNLAISGYWGPLLSWVSVPFIAIGLDAMLGIRIAVGLGAVFFWIAASQYYRSSGLGEVKASICEVLTGIFVVGWSAQTVSPDLWLAGFVVHGTTLLGIGFEQKKKLHFLLAGACFGGAYLSKSIGFPLGILIILMTGALRGLDLFGKGNSSTPRELLHGLGLALSVHLLVSLPWAGVLSNHYEYWTFSTSGRIAHAVVGPSDVDRYHPFARTFHVPETGRITAWEDPSRMDYKYWSPRANSEYASHQWKLFRENLITILILLGSFDLFGFSYIGLIAGMGLWLQTLAERAPRSDWLRTAWIYVLSCGAPYTLVYIKEVDQRYLFGVVPWLISGCMRLDECAFSTYSEKLSSGDLKSKIRKWTILVNVAVWGIASLPTMLGGLQGFYDPASQIARDLAARMKRAGVQGPIAGSGLIAGGRVGLYVAHQLETAWHGDMLRPDAQSVLESKAKVYVCSRKSPELERFILDPRLENLDSRLFPDLAGRESYPVALFGIKPLR